MIIMKGREYSSYVVLRLVLCALVVSCAESQNSPKFNTGIPLPTIKQGQHPPQGQNPDKYTIVLENSENFGVNLPPLTQNVGPHVGHQGASDNRLSAARGPGSLQFIKEPSQDKSVRDLINDPVVLKTIQKETRADKTVKVDYIISAHKQVVSGQLTYLDLKVVKTICLLGSHQRSICPVDTTEDPYVCEIAIWQRPWLNMTKVVKEKTKCAEIEDDNDFKNWNKGRGGLRSMSREITLRSIPHHLDEDQVALEAYDYVDRGSESKFKGRMIQYSFGQVKHDPHLNLTVIEVKVEYGFTLCLKFPMRKLDDRVCPRDRNRTNYICSVHVISDPNLTTNLKVVPNDDDDIDCHKKELVSEELVVPVKAACLGCPVAISLSDPALLPMAEFAVIEYDRTSDEDELHKMVKLHKVMTQAVNGIKYFLTIELAETDCRKPLSAVNMNRTLCNIDLTDNTDICEIVIFEQPWQKSREFVSASCRDSFSADAFIVPSNGLFGVPAPSVGPGSHSGISGRIFTPTPTSLLSDLSASMQESINFLLKEINYREVDDYDDGLFKILNVLKASPVSESIGQVDIIVLELGETVCRGRNVPANCPLKIGEEHEFCTGKVLRRSSTHGGSTTRQVVVLKCDDDKDEHFFSTVNAATSPFLFSRRPFFNAEPRSQGMPGGSVRQETNSQTTTEIAHFIVDQFNLQNDDDELYKLGRVLSSHSKLSGIVKFTLELELLETECKKYQPVLDLSKCPLDRSEEPEVCQAEVDVSFSNDGSSITTKKILRMFCDDRKDYYIKKMRMTRAQNLHIGRGQTSTSENVNGSKIMKLGQLVATEFDLRSGEDHIFVLFKVLAANSLRSGLSHHLRVELAETVCPKYKQTIDKSRCVVDIGEEHKICDAQVEEQPWRNGYHISHLQCFERDDSVEHEDDSREIVYRQVHPSSHSRPKFIQSRYRVRKYSQESDESNEQYYRIGGILHRQQSIEDDSIEFHRFNRRSQSRSDDDINDSNLADSRSNERLGHQLESTEHSSFRSSEGSSRFNSNEQFGFFRSKEPTNRFQFGRQPVKRTKRSTPIMLGGQSSIDVNDPEVQKLASFGLEQMDLQSEDTRLRRTEKILEATKQVVAGILWRIKSQVSYVTCKKEDPQVDLSKCKIDTSEPSQLCDMKIWIKPWENFKELTESKCNPIST